MTMLTFRTRTDAPPVGHPLSPMSAVGDPGCPPTLNDLLALYTAEYLPAQAPNTQAGKRRLFRQLAPDLGLLPLTALTPARLRQWRDELGQRMQPQSVTTYMLSLSAVLTVAVRDYEWLPSNPLAKVRKPTMPPGRVRFLSPEEQQRLLRACEQSPCRMLYPIVLVALTSGCRKMEILLRRWSDVDFEQGSLRLTQTKNKERRAAALPPMTIEVLRQWQAAQSPASVWVFPGERTGSPPARINRPWWRAVAQAGLEDFRFHDLRHSCASYLAMQGCTLLEIAGVLGHKSLTSTKRYAHLSASHTAALVERMTQTMVVHAQVQDGAAHGGWSPPETATTSSLAEVRCHRDTPQPQDDATARAETFRQEVTQQEDSLDSQNHATEIKVRAERRMGEMLQQTALDKGGRPEKTPIHQGRGFCASIPPLKDLGVSYKQSSRWQQIATLPTDTFETYLADTKAQALPVDVACPTGPTTAPPVVEAVPPEPLQPGASRPLEQQILDALQTLAPRPATALQVAGVLRLPRKPVHRCLQRLVRRGTVEQPQREYYRYTAPAKAGEGAPDAEL